MNEKHVGSDFDHFLREERLLEEVEAEVAKRVELSHAPEATNESTAPEEG
jgi:hypothetical protein